APVITTPAEGAALKSVTGIEGTGTPGLTVKITGDLSGSAVVAADGQWTIPVDGAAPGRLSIRAVQTSPGDVDSAPVTRNFTVAPAAPAVTTVDDGSHLSQDALPAAISGTGVDGGDVAVLIDGQPVGTTKTGAGGRWSMPFPAALAPGEHTLSATQTVDGVASDPLLLTFTVDAPADAPTVAPAGPATPADQPTVLPAGSGQPTVLPAASGQSPDTGAGQLADTGAGSLLPTAGLAVGVILLGALLLAGVHLAGARRRAVR
ncbi:MAG TPA: Ig-like domain-containing protein, partial [Arthrobacter sp.]